LPIFAVGFFSFWSWFLFIIYGGIGLSALPLDLIYEFCSRPKKVSKATLDEQKKKLIVDTRKVHELALSVKEIEEREPMKRSSKYKF